MMPVEFICTGCGVRVTTFKFVNYRTIPPSMDKRDLCDGCKRRTAMVDTSGSRVGAAFDKYMETEEAKVLARRFGGAVQFLGIFEAGWKAGIASTNDLEIPAFLRPAPKPNLSGVGQIDDPEDKHG